jgi:O-antigen/teichoic acid export membrane protein
VIIISTGTKALYLLEISVAKGYGRYGVEATASVVVSLVNAVLVLLLYLLAASLNAYLALFAFTCAAHLGIAAHVFRRGQPAAPAGSMDADFRQRIRQHLAWTVVLTVVVAFSGTSVAIYLLNLLVGSAEVGYFVIAASLARGAIDLVASGLTSVLMPMMGHAFGSGGKQRVGALLCDSLRYLQFLGLLAAGLGAFWAEAIIHLLYGEAYAPAIVILQWMLIGTGLTLGESAFGALLSTTDNQRLRAAFAISYLVVSLAASAVLIPTYGLAGAVYACVGSRLVLYVIGLVVVVRMLAIRLPWSALGRIMAASGGSAALAWTIVASFPRPWSGVAAGLVYVALFLASSRYVGIWQEKDVRIVAALGEQYPRVLGWSRTYLNRWIAGLQR